jgi:hypothetical protein
VGGSPLFLAYPHNVTSARTCTVAESTGSLIQGRISRLTTQAGLVLGNKLCAKWGKSADSGREADFPSGWMGQPQPVSEDLSGIPLTRRNVTNAQVAESSVRYGGLDSQVDRRSNSGVAPSSGRRVHSPLDRLRKGLSVESRWIMRTAGWRRPFRSGLRAEGALHVNRRPEGSAPAPVTVATRHWRFLVMPTGKAFTEVGLNKS